MHVCMARISPLVSLSADDLAQVVRWEAAPSTPQQVALRCRLVLAAASGKQDLEIASTYDVNRKFLRRLDREFPGDWELHLVLDNYGTHKTPEVQKWLKRHGRFVLHFIPTSSSWLNLVERWFRELTQKAVRRGAFFSVPDLIAAIEAFLAGWNENPRPFVWTAKLEEILKKIERARAKLESIQPGSTQPRRRRKGEE